MYSIEYETAFQCELLFGKEMPTCALIGGDSKVFSPLTVMSIEETSDKSVCTRIVISVSLYVILSALEVDIIKPFSFPKERPMEQLIYVFR